MSEINTWDKTAANNNSAPPNGWPENMQYSQVNNSARENMAAVARLYADMNGTLVTTGSSNAYLLAPNRAFSAYAAGVQFVLTANHTNTAASTIKVAALGVKGLKNPDGTDVAAGAIISGEYYRVIYSGVHFVLLPMRGLTIADFSASAVLALLLTVDGAGSGIDADLLDGEEGAYYLDAANLSGSLPGGILPAPITTVRGGHKKNSESGTTSGYDIDMETGRCQQWGRNTIGANSSIVVTLPLAYTVAHEHVMASYYTSGVGEVDPPGAIVSGNSGIRLTNSYSSSRTISWLSRGRMSV